MRDIRILTGALLLAGLAADPGWCAAADGPDSLRTEALRSQLEHWSSARVTGPWGAARLTDPRIRAAGLEFLAARPDTPGTDTTALTNPIPLARLYKVETQANSAGKGAIIGGLAGAAIGLALAAMEDQVDLGPTFGNPPHDRTGDYVAGAMLWALPGTALGALLGSAFRHWRTVYAR